MWFGWADDSLILVAHTKKSPEAVTWTAMCQAFAERLSKGGELRTLVFTDGGGPSSSQREELAKVSQSKKHRIGVVSTAPAVRFIVSSMALFNPTIKSFAPAEWKRGLEHIGVPGADARRVEQAVREFADRAGGERFAVLSAILKSAR